MEQKIIDILKNAPEGKIKLYSIVHGKSLEFIKLRDDKENHILVKDPKNDTILVFEPNGSWFKEGDCVLFPDKQHLSWENWQYWLFRWSVGSVIIDSYGNPYLITEEYFYPTNPRIAEDIIRNHKMPLDDTRYATKEETKAFFKELNVNGYYYNEESDSVLEIPKQNKPYKPKKVKPEVGMLLRDKIHDEYKNRVYIIVNINEFENSITLAPINTRSVITLDFMGVENACPIRQNKRETFNMYEVVTEDILYDPHFLEPFDRVLVKNLNTDKWRIEHFSHLENGKFVCEKEEYNICIPFNRVTKHLVGTNNTPAPIYNMKIQ